MKVTVTQSDIDKGQRHELRNCPIALSIARMGYSSVSIGRTTACYWEGQSYHRRVMPTVAEQFTSDFDQGQPVKPFTFDLV